ncbi:MAG: hypothetical protein CBARDMAM_5360 [uncultured Caballeronia sp.]|nr:MAG: hypothetical protein CBARDMAM_5360 [uncultured Caballeronia sp.]
MMCLLEVMHRIIRHTVQVWYRLDAGIRILPGVRIGGAVQGHPDTTAQQKLKHKVLDLHNERTFRYIVMHFCNFSVSAKTFADGNIVRSMHHYAPRASNGRTLRARATASLTVLMASFVSAGTETASFDLGAGWTSISDRFFGTISVASLVWNHQCQKLIRSDSCRI